jgi:pimeloyl-ACP methyl ester carboxylesterase
MQNRIDVGAISTSYNRICNTTNPKRTIVFLHGWKGSSRSWDKNVEELSKTYDCITLDLPGFGNSTEPKSVWNVAEYAEFVKAFVKTLGISKFELVGKSFGGRVAIVFASRWPELLAHLVLASAAGTEKRSLATQARISVAKLGKTVLGILGVRNLEILRTRFYKATAIEADQSPYLWEVKKLVTNTDLAKVARTIRVPTLIVWGTKDKMLPLQVGQKLNKTITGSTLKLIENGGHNANQENMREFNNIVADFLG